MTYINMAFLSNIRPILGSNTCLPFKIDGQRRLGLVIRSPETSHVISSLHCHKCELPRGNLVRIVIIVPKRRSYLQKDVTIQNQNQQENPLKTWFEARGYAKLGIFSRGTRTVTLWESATGTPSLGLTTLYLPTVMELLFMSSEMHLVWPDWSSNLRDSIAGGNNPTTRRRRRGCGFNPIIVENWRKIEVQCDSRQNSTEKTKEKGEKKAIERNLERFNTERCELKR